MINRVTLIGRLGKDPEIRRLENGAVVAKFSIATNESYKDKSGNWQDQTEWHDVVAWRYLAEKAERDLKKGKLAFIEGKLTHRKWQDAEGKDRYSTEVVARVIRLMEKRDDGGNYGSSGYFPGADDAPPASTNTSSNDSPSVPKTESNSVVEAADDDLPF